MIPCIGFSQNFTSYLIGNQNSVATNPEGGICLMGGASEDDNAMRWFLERVNGGDVLVLRTSGSDGYNSYLYNELGVSVNSVETIVCNSAEASHEPYVLQKIHEAEGIWFAGGDQWTYVSYWRNTPINEAINLAILQRNIVIGGTSAGMAIQSDYYFSAQNGTVTSSEALLNPYNENMTIDSSGFIQNTILKNTITDTHFDNPDRKGRLITFLARIVQDYGTSARAIACDEFTAVCIDNNGVAKVFGGYPEYDDIAYFIQSNCELPSQIPENCTEDSPLTWDLNNQAVKAYVIKGGSSGNNTFDLDTWQTGNGGVWENWSVTNGAFQEQTGSSINCSLTSINDFSMESDVVLYPNPATDLVNIFCNQVFVNKSQIQLLNNFGTKFIVPKKIIGHQIELDISNLNKGIYYLVVQSPDGIIVKKKLVKI